LKIICIKLTFPNYLLINKINKNKKIEKLIFTEYIYNKMGVYWYLTNITKNENICLGKSNGLYINDFLE
jgi:hypothetical protein